QGRRLREGGVGEMGRISHARALFLGRDLPRKIAGHVLEIEDHRLDRGNLASFLACLESPQSQCSVTWLHCSIPPTCSYGRFLLFARRKMLPDSGRQPIKQATCQTISSAHGFASNPRGSDCWCRGLHRHVTCLVQLYIKRLSCGKATRKSVRVGRVARLLISLS